jgi:hypothetical protein
MAKGRRPIRDRGRKMNPIFVDLYLSGDEEAEEAEEAKAARRRSNLRKRLTRQR